MKYDGRLYTQAEVDAMNNTPKTVESLINEAETKWASQGRTDEQKWAVRNFITGSMQEAITAHINAEIAKVLERLESELNEQKKAAETNLAYHTDVTKNERLIRDWQGTVHGIEFCRPAIQAERAKLKELV